MEITKLSFVDNQYHTLNIDITPEQYQQVENRRETGIHIQKIIPHISAPEREFLMTGITPKQWEEMFSGLDDEDSEVNEDDCSIEYPAF